MKIVVKIIAGLLITAILVAVGYFGYLFYKNDFSFKKMFGIGVSDKLIEEKEIEGLKNLEIEFNTGAVEIKPGEDTKIKVMIFSDRECEHNINTEVVGTVKVSINEKKLSFFKHIFNHKQSRVLVYIPKDYEGNITVNGDVGDITLSDYQYATFTSKLNVGDIYADGVKSANIDLDVGSAKIKNLYSDCNIVVNTGDLKMKEVKILKDSSIKVDIGNVSIQEINDVKVESKVDVGKENIEQKNQEALINLKVEVNVGNITILVPKEEEKKES